MTPNKVSSLEKSIGFVIQFRLVFMSLMGLLMVLSGVYTLKNLSIDNSLGIWFLEEDPSYQAYIEYQETYGSDEIFMVMLPVPNALDQDQIDQLKALNTALDKLPFVETAYSLAKAKYPVIVGKKLRFRPLYEEKRSEKSIKNLWEDMPEVVQQLVSKDYKNLFLYVQLRPTPDIEKDRKDIAQEIETLISRYFKSYHITGPPVLNEAYNKEFTRRVFCLEGSRCWSLLWCCFGFCPEKNTS
jgi:predicted RND superfamily exporter protein